MKLSIQAGATSQTVNIWIQDSSSTIGAALTGLVFNSAGLTAYYALPKAAAVSISLVTLAAITTAWTSGGFKEVDATNMPGWYRLDIPDAALASGRFVSIHLKGASNMAPLPIEIELTGWNNQDAVRGGMTAMPNANAGATNGLPLSVDSSGRVDVLKINGTSQTARDIGASVLLSSGSGAGQLDFTSGVVKANATQWLGGTIPAVNVTGVPKVDVFDWLGTGAPANTGDAFARIGAAGAGLTALGDTRIANLDATISSRTKPADTQAAVTLVTTTTNLTNAPTAGDLTATMKTSVTTAATAATPTVTLAAAAVTAIWAALTSALTTVGSIGKLLVDNIDAAISSRLATSGYTAAPTAAQNADKLLGRNLAGGSDGGRTVTDALRPSRNKVTVGSGTMTVYAEDDTTPAWTGALTTDAAAVPIVAVDPT